MKQETVATTLLSKGTQQKDSIERRGRAKVRQLQRTSLEQSTYEAHSSTELPGYQPIIFNCSEPGFLR